jgi:hypothetical protein
MGKYGSGIKNEKRVLIIHNQKRGILRAPSFKREGLG